MTETKDRGDLSATPQASTQPARQVLVSLYVQGSTNDAKAMYSATPGASDEGWQILSRMLEPVKQFIQDGGHPYTEVGRTTEYAGIPVPEPEVPPLDGGTTDPPPDARASENLVTGGVPSASELIDRAKKATTQEELDEIESVAAGRVTVLDAVEAREEELTKS